MASQWGARRPRGAGKDGAGGSWTEGVAGLAKEGDGHHGCDAGPGATARSNKLASSTKSTAGVNGTVTTTANGGRWWWDGWEEAHEDSEEDEEHTHHDDTFDIDRERERWAEGQRRRQFIIA